MGISNDLHTHNILIVTGPNSKIFADLCRAPLGIKLSNDPVNKKHCKLFQVAAVNLMRSQVVKENRFAAVVFDCDSLDKRELVSVKRVSELTLFVPVLVLANEISFFSYRRIDVLKNTIVMQKPCSTEVILSLIERMSTTSVFNSAAGPRFITDVPARIINLRTGLLIPTRMRNYSASGAFFEYKGLAFKVGDSVEIHIDLQNPDSFDEGLRLNEKILWLRGGESAHRADGTSILRGVGVEFTRVAPAVVRL